MGCGKLLNPDVKILLCDDCRPKKKLENVNIRHQMIFDEKYLKEKELIRQIRELQDKYIASIYPQYIHGSVRRKTYLTTMLRRYNTLGLYRFEIYRNNFYNPEIITYFDYMTITGDDEAINIYNHEGVHLGEIFICPEIMDSFKLYYKGELIQARNSEDMVHSIALGIRRNIDQDEEDDE